MKQPNIHLFRIVYGLLCLISFTAYAQKEKPPRLNPDNFRNQARSLIMDKVPALYSTIMDDNIDETDLSTVVKGAFLLTSTDQIFYNDAVIIEDDINPNHINTTNHQDMPVEKYLNNINQFIRKEGDGNAIVITAVRTGSVFMDSEHPRIKVFFRSVWKGKHKQVKRAYQPVDRVAECVGEYVNKKWRVYIETIRFELPGESIDFSRSTTAKAQQAANAGPENVVIKIPATLEVAGKEVVFVRPDNARDSLILKWNRQWMDVKQSTFPAIEKGFYQRVRDGYAAGTKRINLPHKDSLVFTSDAKNFTRFVRKVIPKPEPVIAKSITPPSQSNAPASAPPILLPGDALADGPEVLFRQTKDPNVRLTIKWNRQGLRVIQSSSWMVKRGFYYRNKNLYINENITLELQSKDAIRAKLKEQFEDYVRVGEVARPVAAPPANTTQVAAVTPKSAPTQAVQPSADTARTAKMSGSRLKLFNRFGRRESTSLATKSTEIPKGTTQPVSSDLKKSLDGEQKKISSSKRKLALIQIGAGVAGLAGSFVGYSGLRKSYQDYSAKVDRLNADYSIWSQLNRQPGVTAAPLKAQSMTSYSGAGIYGVYGGAVISVGAIANGIRTLMKAR